MLTHITIMVISKNLYLDLLPGLPPPPPVDDQDKSDRKLADSCLWDLQEIVDIVSRHSPENVTVRMVTRKAERDFQNLLENGFDLHELLKKLLEKGFFKGSWWCRTSAVKDRTGKPRGTGYWVPCDAYSIVDEYEHPATGYRGKSEIYLKMCKGHDGTAVLFVSLHQ